MSLKIRWAGVVLVSNVLLLSSTSFATQSIWPKLNTKQAQLTTDVYKNISCSKLVPDPFTGPLLIESKYNQSDESKSTLTTTSSESKAILKKIKLYMRGLLSFSKTYKRATNSNEANRSLACLSRWLDEWARADALLNPEATKTGIAIRKWALAAISSIILNIEGYSNGKYEITALQKEWLTRLAELVISEYEPRRKKGFSGYFNNHDYWAGWAVASTGLVIGDDAMLAWGHVSLQKALTQVVTGDDGSYAWLPYEVARGKLGADYSNYAMVPLLLLANTAKANQLPLSEDEKHKIQLLANFAAMAILDPDSLPQLEGAQKSFSAQKMVWLIPFLTMYPDNKLTKEAYMKKNGKVDSYSQIGGAIKEFYPSVKE